MSVVQPVTKHIKSQTANDPHLSQVCAASPAALLLLLRGEDVGGELQDVVSSQSRQLTQTALQLPAASLQQLPQAPVVALDFIPFLLVTSSTTLQPLALLLRAQEEVLICRRRKRRRRVMNRPANSV